jgi:hypothetical protein
MTPIVAPLELLINGGEDFEDNDEYEPQEGPIRGGISGDVSSPSAIASKPSPSVSAPRPRSVGIGDGGNEVGMGKILDTILQSSIPNASSIACIVPTDHLIVASVSNWGKCSKPSRNKHAKYTFTATTYSQFKCPGIKMCIFHRAPLP